MTRSIRERTQVKSRNFVSFSIFEQRWCCFSGDPRSRGWETEEWNSTVQRLDSNAAAAPSRKNIIKISEILSSCIAAIVCLLLWCLVTIISSKSLSVLRCWRTFTAAVSNLFFGVSAATAELSVWRGRVVSPRELPHAAGEGEPQRRVEGPPRPEKALREGEEELHWSSHQTQRWGDFSTSQSGRR